MSVNLILYSIVITTVAYFILSRSIVVFKYIKLIIKNKRKYNEKMLKVKEMKKRGEAHDWVNLKILGMSTYVCKKTGYCPDIDGFVDLKVMDKEIKKKEEFESAVEDYGQYRDDKMKLIAERYQLKLSEVKDIQKDLDGILTSYINKKDLRSKSDSK